MAGLEFEPRASHGASSLPPEPHGQPVTFFSCLSCLVRFDPESARNNAGTDKTVPLLFAAQARTHTGHQMSQGQKKNIAQPVAQLAECHSEQEALGLNPGRATFLFWPLKDFAILFWNLSMPFDCLDCRNYFHNSLCLEELSNGETGNLRSFLYQVIMKTCLCNVYPLKPHFYMEKWGLQGYTYFSYFCSKT